MQIIAFDLGTTTGWASWTGLVHSGTLNLANKRHEGGGMRYLKFRRELAEIFQHPYDAVYYEEVRRHVATDAAHVYGGLLAVLSAECESRNIPYQGVPVGTIKKHWTGKGNAGKDQMIAEAVARGFNPKDDNEADALALLDWALVENKC